MSASTLAMVRFSWSFSLNSATGAVSHEPRHSRASSVNLPSSVVSCGSMPRRTRTWSMSFWWPHTSQAIDWQMPITHLPTGSVWNSS